MLTDSKEHLDSTSSFSDVKYRNNKNKSSWEQYEVAGLKFVPPSLNAPYLRQTQIHPDSQLWTDTRPAKVNALKAKIAESSRIPRT